MEDQRPRSGLPSRRAQFQSTVLVWIAVPLLAFAALYPFVRAPSIEAMIFPVAISLAFALLAWLAKAATPPAAAIGFLVCLSITGPSAQGQVRLPHTALPALITLVLLTLFATRFGRSKKEAHDLAERREGRRASQIVANLSVAALCSAFGWHLASIAALAEAAADTVSSEIGQAIGGSVWLLTSWRRVPAGTNGGISLAGSAAGVLAAAIVVSSGMFYRTLRPEAAIAFAAACAALFFDSLLGATVENRGWLGNDLVNLCSTSLAAIIAAAFFGIFQGR